MNKVLLTIAIIGCLIGVYIGFNKSYLKNLEVPKEFSLLRMDKQSATYENTQKNIGLTIGIEKYVKFSDGSLEAIVQNNTEFIAKFVSKLKSMLPVSNETVSSIKIGDSVCIAILGDFTDPKYKQFFGTICNSGDGLIFMGLVGNNANVLRENVLIFDDIMYQLG